jgi:hypothetical protein
MWQAVQAAQNDAFSVGPLPIIPQPSFDDVVTELQQTRELVAKLMTCIQAIQQGFQFYERYRTSPI